MLAPHVCLGYKVALGCRVGLSWADRKAFVPGPDPPHYNIPNWAGGDIISSAAQLTSGPGIAAPGEVYG